MHKNTQEYITKTNKNFLLFQQIFPNIVQIFLGNDIHADPAIQIELCRPVPTSRDKSQLALWVIPFYVGFRPTQVYVASSR